MGRVQRKVCQQADLMDLLDLSAGDDSLDSLQREDQAKQGMQILKSLIEDVAEQGKVGKGFAVRVVGGSEGKGKTR